MIAENILVESELVIFVEMICISSLFESETFPSIFFNFPLVETRKIYIWRVSLWSSALPPPLERQKDGFCRKAL